MYQDEHEYCDIRDENNTSNDEDEYYYCEICDRDFVNEKLLINHKNTHRICGIDDCTFEAHPKIVEKHITMQHCTGLYHRMKNIKTPEDIEKWIAERKKKYPTKINIEMKKAENSEKKERGEIIEQSRGKMKHSQGKRRVRERKRRRKKQKKIEIKAEFQGDEEIECCRGIKAFRGTNSLKHEDVDSEPEIISSAIQFTGDEDDSFMPITSGTQDKPMLSLVADYGSDSDEPPEEIPIKKLKNEEPEPIPPTKKEQVMKEKYPRKELLKQTEVISKLTRKMVNQQKRTMLLERLLSRSIQHERNYICQCIKHIVDNNFFD